MRAGDRRFGGWRQPAAVALAILFVLPLWFLVAGSLREPGTVPPRTPELLPRPVSTEAYADAFELVDLGRYLLNSIAVAVLTVPAAVLIASWAGFALLLLAGRARVVLLTLSFVALMIPVTALIVPRFTLYRWLGLTDTWVPLVAPALAHRRGLTGRRRVADGSWAVRRPKWRRLASWARGGRAPGRRGT